jgi:hypothetical protein
MAGTPAPPDARDALKQARPRYVPDHIPGISPSASAARDSPTTIRTAS